MILSPNKILKPSFGGVASKIGVGGGDFVFTFEKLFEQGENGMLLIPAPDANYPQYIEDTGINAAAADQVAGFVTDRSKGGFGNLGAQLISNSEFDSNTTGWGIRPNTKGVVSWNNGVLRFQRDADDTILSTGVNTILSSLVANSFYLARASIRNVALTTENLLAEIRTSNGGGGGQLLQLMPGPIGSTSFVPTRGIYLHNSGSVYPTMRLGGLSSGGGESAELDYFRVHHVPGHHAVQATSANRPLIKTENGLWYWQPDQSNDRWTAPGLTLTQPFTVCMAVRLTDTASQTLLSGVTGTPARIRVNSSKQIEINAGTAVAGQALTLPDTVIVSAIFAGANSRVRINGGGWSTGNAGSNGMTSARIFANAAGTGEFMGDRCYGIVTRAGDLESSWLLGHTEQALAELAGITL